jgi:hypothetical protein
MSNSPSPAASGAASPVPKSKNEEKNEAKRLAKLAKFEAKQQKLKEQESVSLANPGQEGPSQRT